MIEVKNLVKAYEGRLDLALSDVSFSVAEGECFGLLGPNGAGKTTLMGCMLGLLNPDEGTVRIDGLDPNDLAVRELLGFLPERPFFESWYTAIRFISYHHALAGRPATLRKKEVVEVLQTVHLQKEAWDRKINKFSRGMLQRLGLAQALVAKPRILFLDEPGSGMDPPGVAILREILLSLKKEKVTIVLNSHHLDEMERICDRVAFIKGGKIDSIKAISEGDDLPHVLRIRWISSVVDQDSRAAADQSLQKLVTDTGASILEVTESGARIEVENASMAAELIRQFVLLDIPIQSASPESTSLERLFEKE